MQYTLVITSRTQVASAVSGSMSVSRLIVLPKECAALHCVTPAHHLHLCVDMRAQNMIVGQGGSMR